VRLPEDEKLLVADQVSEKLAAEKEEVEISARRRVLRRDEL
jgi:hypothetical protein